MSSVKGRGGADAVDVVDVDVDVVVEVRFGAAEKSGFPSCSAHKTGDSKREGRCYVLSHRDTADGRGARSCKP